MKSIKITIVDDAGTVLDTHDVDLARFDLPDERRHLLALRIGDDISEISSKVRHEIERALALRKNAGVETPRMKLRAAMTRGRK